MVAVSVPGAPIVGPESTVQVNGAVVAATPSESVIVTVTLGEVPAVVGAPLMAPVVALIVSPAGAPARLNVHGLLGQVEATARLTDCPTAVDWLAGLVTVGAATTCQVKVIEPLRPNASMTRTVTGVAA